MAGVQYLGSVLKQGIDPEKDSYDLSDFSKIRELTLNSVKEAVGKRFPVANERYTLHIDKLDYEKGKPPTLRDQREALVTGATLGRKLKGSWTLTDNVTGKPVSSTGTRTIVSVPWLTDRGTYIRNGHEYTLAHVLRMRPGVYSRIKSNGLAEAQINVEPGTGAGMRLEMNPDNGVLSIKKGGVSARLYPILRSMGVPDEQMATVWGPDLLMANKAQSVGSNVTRNLRAFSGADKEIHGPITKESSEHALEPDVAGRIAADFDKTRLDPESTALTLGHPFDRVGSSMLLMTSKRLLDLSRGKGATDNRDSLEYQKVYGHPELFAERILKDGGGVSRKLLWKATNKGHLDFLQAGALQPHVDSIFDDSRLAQYVEGSSPFDMLDNALKVTRLGEGGLGDIRAAPEDSGARAVHNSYMGYIDPVRTPESIRGGLDAYAAKGVRKGLDGLLYTKLRNVRTGQDEWVDMRRAALANVTTPDQLKAEGNVVPVLGRGGDFDFVKKNEVDYVLPNASRMFSLGAMFVPLKSGNKGLRLNMGSRYMAQALPLTDREAPLVRVEDPDAPGQSVEDTHGHFFGARRAPSAGVVESVNKNGIKVKYLDGTSDNIELYNNYPANMKGYLHNEPRVKPGETFKKGDTLASSNYTDDHGRAAVGRNMRVAYISWHGQNFEDATCVSESAAKKLSHEAMYHHHVPNEKDVVTETTRYRSIWPGKFNDEQLKKVGDDGMAKPGVELRRGDPVLLAFKVNEPSPGTLGRRVHQDMSETWEHDYPGVVVEGVAGKERKTVYTKASVPLCVGDKMTGRHGNKGVVGVILPDAEMPRDKDGKPFDVTMSPLGIISRTNPSSMVEAALGKVAAKRGESSIVKDFMDGDSNMAQYALSELKRHGLEEHETVVDPMNSREIPKIFTGNAFFYKLKHTAEGKEAGRGAGDEEYTTEETPGGQGISASKRLGGLETSALVGHGTWEFLRDAKLIRGQTNSDFWRDLRSGKTPSMPGSPLVREKFFNHLKGAGVNMIETKDAFNIFGMTGDEAKTLGAGREVRAAATFDDKHFRPIPGGLFDPAVFGADGKQWGHIKLDEPIPNPVMTDSLRRILKLTEEQYNNVVIGKDKLQGATGGEAIGAALGKVNLEEEIRAELAGFSRLTGARRDASMKRLRAMIALKDAGKKPADFMMRDIPVLPPRFRPITTQGGTTLVSDTNYLYKKLLDSRDDLQNAKTSLPEEEQNVARHSLWNNYQSLVGLSDPDDAKLKDKNVKGLLKWIFGDSPKLGGFQRRLVATSMDMTGRGVITPNPGLKLNQIGLPEAQAWEIYEPFVVRELVRQGYQATDAVRMTSEKNKLAYEALRKAVLTRPVVMNRAPTLHKFSIMGFWPVLTKGSTIQVSPSIVEPFNADFDGDAVNLYVPVGQKAIDEVKDKMLPERNLLNVRGFQAHYLPIREYAQGVYLASRVKPGPAVKSFKTEGEAIQAYKRGEIGVDDPVRVVEKK